MVNLVNNASVVVEQNEPEQSKETLVLPDATKAAASTNNTLQRVTAVTATIDDEVDGRSNEQQDGAAPDWKRLFAR